MTPYEYQEIPYPSSRRQIFDMGQISHDRHHITVLVDIDVTAALEAHRNQPRGTERVSFFAMLLKIVADIVAENPQVAAFNLPRKGRVVVFKDVNICTALEKEVAGSLVPLTYVIHSAQKKSALQIQQELQTAQEQQVRHERDYLLGDVRMGKLTRSFLSLPGWLRVWLMKTVLLANPRLMHQITGNVWVTTAGIAGYSRNWVIPSSIHPLCVGFGSVNPEPRVLHGKVAVRQVLHVTLIIDHNSVDSGPARRVMEKMIRRLELYGSLEREENS